MNRVRQTAGAAIALLISISATAARQDPPPTQDTPTSQDEGAAAKAAARKKRFDEMKKHLEEQNPPAPAATQPQATAAAPKPAAKAASERPGNVIFSMPVTMAVDDLQQFYLYDSDSKVPDVTKLARWTIDDDSEVANLSVAGGVPNVTGRKKGAVSLFATFNDRTAEVRLTVIPREELNSNTVRWSQNSPTDKSPFHIMPAIPQHIARQ